MRRLELEIEELVMHGFEPRDRELVARALRDELTRLVGAREATTSVPRVFEAARPREIGMCAARAVAADVSAARRQIKDRIP